MRTIFYLTVIFVTAVCPAVFAQQTYDGHLSLAKSLIPQQKYADAVKEAE